MTEHDTTTITQHAVDAAIYRMGPVPARIAGHLFQGIRENLITNEQVPRWAGSDGTFEQWEEHLAAIGKLIRDSGADVSYAAGVKADAVVITCPWWCEAKHPEIVAAFDSGVTHELEVVRVEPGEGSAFKEPFTVSIQAWDDPDVDGLGRRLHVPLDQDDMTNLTEQDARDLAQMLTAAADRMARLGAVEGAQ